MKANPLTKADLSIAQNGLYEARECERECERAKACNLDVTEQEARKEHLKRFFQAVLEQYPIIPAQG